MVERHRHGAGRYDAEVRRDPVGAVGCPQRHAFAGHDTARAQAVCDVCDALAERGIGKLFDAVGSERNDRRAIATRRECRDEVAQRCERRRVAAIGHECWQGEQRRLT